MKCNCENCHRSHECPDQCGYHIETIKKCICTHCYLVMCHSKQFRSKLKEMGFETEEVEK